MASYVNKRGNTLAQKLLGIKDQNRVDKGVYVQPYRDIFHNLRLSQVNGKNIHGKILFNQNFHIAQIPEDRPI